MAVDQSLQVPTNPHTRVQGELRGKRERPGVGGGPCSVILMGGKS